MTRSPLAYPLNRSADMDAGGAADLQTDIMRFMAILSLCLVAIFALVQSIPMRPAEPARPVERIETVTSIPAVTPIDTVEPAETMTSITAEQLAAPAKRPQAAVKKEKPVDTAVSLTRPKWTPKFVPQRKTASATPVAAPAQPTKIAAAPEAAVEEVPPPAETESEGFTLRFESDSALTRLVAANRIGLYAVASGRAQRMTVSDSRISFWDASTPNTYHEMETATVPAAVIDALGRTGTQTSQVSWGVTLPGRLKTELDDLMLEHRGGTLIIVSNGTIRWEAT